MSRAVPFEQILRPLYELRSVIAWAAAALWCLIWGIVLDFGGATIFLLVVMCAALCAWRAITGYRLARKKIALIGHVHGRHPDDDGAHVLPGHAYVNLSLGVAVVGTAGSAAPVPARFEHAANLRAPMIAGYPQVFCCKPLKSTD